MNATSFRPWTALLATPVVLIGFLVVAPVDSEAAAPSNSQSATARKKNHNKKAQKAAPTNPGTQNGQSQPQRNKSGLGKTTKKHKHHHRHHKHKKHHKKSRTSTSRVSTDMARVRQDEANLHRDEQALNRDRNQLRRVLR